MNHSTIQRIVDADHPWLGLTPFTEKTKEYFFGRDREIRDLFLRVREQPLTVLYGQSGLGKTSILGAGLIPKLEVEGFRPCLIRLGYEPSDAPAVSQAAMVLAKRIYPEGHAKEIRSNETLWEMLHHLPTRPSDLAEHPPVLIFDQFEEIFTLTDTADRKREARDFFHQLADVIENRPPQLVQERMRENRRLAREYDLGTTTVRVVITLREDYLSQLESWKKSMPSLMRNRVGLRQLDGPQALEAVVRPGQREGRHLVSDNVGATIVRFVAKRPPETPLEEIGAVPPLLSLLCDELNESRLAAGESMITEDQVQRQSADILQNFYTRSFDNLPSAVRRYVEDRMVTVGGHRNPVAREDAVSELTTEGVPDAAKAIEALILNRLLNAEERGGVQRLEITHDVLAPLVVLSRDQRRERERAEKAEREREESRRQRRRLQQVAAVMIALTTLALGAAGLAIRSTLQARRQEARAIEQERIAKEHEQAANKAKNYAEAAEKASHQAKQEATIRLAEKIEQSKEASGALFNYGLAEYESARIFYSTNILTRAWNLRADDDPLKEHYARVIVDKLTHGRRSWIDLRHTNAVRFVAFSPDGSRVTTASFDKTARLWDAQTGASLGEPMRHDGEVTSVVFSPDGSRVATASWDSTSRLWNSQTGESLGEPMRHDGEVNSVVFSSDGSHVATASWDKTARLWDAQTGTPLGEPMRHDDIVWLVVFSPDGSRLATASKDSTARLWDAQTGAPRGEPMRHDSGVYSVAFSPDGSRVATASHDSTARLWDAQTGTPLGEPMRHDSLVNSLAFGPDGSRVATASLDKTARLWDAQTGTPLGEPMRHDSSVVSVAFSPDGSRVATASKDSTARLWNIQTAAPLGELMRHNDLVNSVAFSPDGSRVATASKDKTARIWDAKTEAPLGKPMRHNNSVDSLAFSPDGSRVATASKDQTAQLWDAQTGSPLGKPMRHDNAVGSVVFSPDGSRVATASWDKTARLWDAQTGASLGEPMRHDGPVRSLAFSPDGSRVATASHDSTARLWDAQTGAPLGEPMRHATFVFSVAFSLDGSRVATASHDSTARLWDAQTGAPLGEPMQHNSSVDFLAFSPDGSRVATASMDKTARMWDAQTGAPLGEPMQHNGSVGFLAFSPDGSLLATASKDSSARLWDAQTLAPLGEPMRHHEVPISVAFSPDGSRLVTASGGSVTLFEIDQMQPKNLSRFISHSTGASGSTPPWDSEFEHKLVALQHKNSLRYRQSTAITAVKEKDWFAAKFHLPWLIEHEPFNSRWKDLLTQVQSLNIEGRLLDIKIADTKNEAVVFVRVSDSETIMVWLSPNIFNNLSKSGISFNVDDLKGRTVKATGSIGTYTGNVEEFKAVRQLTIESVENFQIMESELVSNVKGKPNVEQ